MCRLLRVSRSGFYAWQQRPPSAREMANRRLSKEIRTIHHEVNGSYGHRRIKAEMTAMGHACGRHRVARLMREASLRVRSRKRWRLVSSSRHAAPIAPNHLDRQFASDRANRHWVSDMTGRPKAGCIWPSCSISIRAPLSAGQCTTACRRLWYMPRWRWPLHAGSHRRRCCCTRIVAANIAPMTTRHCCGGIASCLVIRDEETVGIMRRWRVSFAR